jgi:hypothetical protein
MRFVTAMDDDAGWRVAADAPRVEFAIPLGPSLMRAT